MIDPNKHHGEKAVVIVAAFLAGGGYGGFMWAVGLYPILAIALGILVTFLYVMVAAGAANAFLAMRSWAYCGQVQPLHDEDILLVGALWPFSFCIGALIYTFIGIVNRSF